MDSSSVMDHVATSSRSKAGDECTRDYASEFTATQTFKSKEELINRAKKVGRSNNITVVVLRSDSGKGKKKPRVTLGCERSGKFDTRYKRRDFGGRRHTGSKKCGCPFLLMGKKLDDSDEWLLTVIDGKHNHEAEDTAGKKQQGHSFEGRLSQEEKSLVKDLYYKRKKSREMLRALKERDEHNKSTARTIYNESQRLERIKLFEDKSSRWLQSMSKAKEYSFIERHRTSPKTGTALDFFWTHPTCLELLLAFPTVLIIKLPPTAPSGWDRYNWATLEIFGVTSTDTAFHVAWALLCSKHRSSYEWAFRSLRDVMDDYRIAVPHSVILRPLGYKIRVAPLQAINDVFCTAKVLLTPGITNDSVRRYLRNISEADMNSFMNKWGSLTASPTEADYDQRLMRLRTDFDMYPKLLDDVTRTFLEPFKEMFVAAWTDQIMHFGIPYLDVCEWFAPGWTFYNLASDKRWEYVHGIVEMDNTKVKAALKVSLDNKYNDEYGHPELKELHGTISIRALELIRKQTIEASRTDFGEKCSCTIRRTHDLPCAHEIANYMRHSQPIPPEYINSHWRTLELKPLIKNNVNVEGRFKRQKLSAEMNTDTRSVDIVESDRNSPNAAGPSTLPPTQDNRQPDDMLVYNIQSTKQLDVVDVCPPVLQTYIHDVEDVPRDGHCGFTVIASLLGITEEDGRPGWKRVRNDLQNELRLYPDHYAHLFGSKEEVDKLRHRLDCFQTPCPEKHWMIMPYMGHIIASFYGVVLMLLSSAQKQCFTFFPLKTAPTSLSCPAEIAIGFCDRHFVPVLFKADRMYYYPMPPAAPLLSKRELSDFDEHQQNLSREWASRYSARIKQFGSILQPIVVSHGNPIVLDT